MEHLTNGSTLAFLDLMGIIGLQAYWKSQFDALTMKIDLAMGQEGNKSFEASALLESIKDTKQTVDEILVNLRVLRSAGSSLEKRVIMLEEQALKRSSSTPLVREEPKPVVVSRPPASEDSDVDDALAFLMH